MKNLFFLMAILCLTAVGAKAQYTAMGFRNFTSCTVYVQYFGTTSPTCTTTHSSAIIPVGPAGILPYSDPSMVPGLGLTASDYITMVRVYHNYYLCSTPVTYVDMSDCPLLGVMTAPSYPIINNSCSHCATSTGTITFNISSPTAAYVDVNP